MPEDVEPEDESARIGEGQIAKLVRKLAQNEGIYQSGLQDLLNGELRHLCEIWRIDTKKDPEIIRQAVQQRLTAYLKDLAPPKSSTPETQGDRNRQFQDCYRVLFNLDASNWGHERTLLEKRKAHFMQRTGVSKPTVDRDLTYAVKRIEALILRDNKPPTPPAALSTLPPTLSEPVPLPTERVAAADALVEEEQRSDRRRKAVKFAVASGLAVIVVATGIFLDQRVSGLPDTPPDSGTTSTPKTSPKAISSDVVPAPQPNILVIAPLQYVQGVGQGFSYAFTHPPTLSAQDLAEANAVQSDWKGMFAWAQPRHGVITDEAVVSVVINNPQDGTATITNVGLVDKHCQAPLSGGLMYSPPAASTTAIQMRFDLDTPSAEPHIYQAGTDSGPYFTGPSAQHIDVVHNQPQEVLMHFVTSKFDCQFRVQIDVTAANGTTASYIISDGGKPFEVTTIPRNPSTGLSNFTGYKEMWAGGVASPNDTGATPNDNFVAVDPKTFCC